MMRLICKRLNLNKKLYNHIKNDVIKDKRYKEITRMKSPKII